MLSARASHQHQPEAEGSKVQTVLGKDTEFNGTLKFKGSLRIDGKFEGEIITEGYLEIGDGAKVKANIKAGTVAIAGEVIGNVDAKERVDMRPTAKLVGNIKTKRLTIADGVVFKGSCEMPVDIPQQQEKNPKGQVR